MEEDMKDNGKMENNMVKVIIIYQMAQKKQDYGKMVRIILKY